MPLINFKKIIQKDPLPMTKDMSELWTNLAYSKVNYTRRKNSAVEGRDEQICFI